MYFSALSNFRCREFFISLTVNVTVNNVTTGYRRPDYYNFSLLV